MMCLTAVGQEQSDSLGRSNSSSCPSTWTKYGNLAEKYSIVRSNIMNHVVYIQERTPLGGNLHTFIIRKYNQSQAMAFSTYFTTLKIRSIIITDMRLYEDTCYFCGRVNWPENSSGPTSQGFVGHFVINEIIGDSGSVHYYFLDSTAYLTRLAISKTNGFPLLISAIGERHPSGMACIVELKNNGATGWTRISDTIKGVNNLVLSDIMTLRDSVTLLAQYACVICSYISRCCSCRWYS